MSELVERARALGPQIVAAQSEMDAMRRLPDGLAAAFLSAELYRLGIPRVHGGLEADPRTIVETIEALARDRRFRRMVRDDRRHVGGFRRLPAAGSRDRHLPGSSADLLWRLRADG